MNKFLLMIAALLITAAANGQTADTAKTKGAANSGPVVTIDEPIGKEPPQQVYTAVEESPEFPGGLQAFYKFLAMNVRYPQEAREKKIQGRVIVQFIVERDGSLSDVKIVR